jgi:hypothetical protein
MNVQRSAIWVTLHWVILCFACDGRQSAANLNTPGSSQKSSMDASFDQDRLMQMMTEEERAASFNSSTKNDDSGFDINEGMSGFTPQLGTSSDSTVGSGSDVGTSSSTSGNGTSGDGSTAGSTGGQFSPLSRAGDQSSSLTCETAVPPNFTFEPLKVPYHFKVNATAPLPSGSRVRLYRFPQQERERWFNKDGTTQALEALREPFKGYPGLAIERLSPHALLCYALKNSGNVLLDGMFRIELYNPLDGKYSYPPPTAMPFELKFDYRLTDLDLLKCVDRCPSCEGNNSRTAADFVSGDVIELAAYNRGCNIQAIRGKGSDRELSIEVAPKLFDEYGASTRMVGKKVYDKIHRLRGVMGGFDKLSCLIWDPLLMEKYKGPHDELCPCEAATGCTARVPNDPKTLSCRRVEECNKDRFAPELGLSGSPTDWRAGEYEIVNENNIFRIKWNTVGKSMTVKFDRSVLKEHYRKALKDALAAQIFQTCNGGPMGALQGSCGQGKLSDADIDDFINRNDSCGIWNMPKTYEMILSSAEYHSCSFHFQFKDETPLGECTYNELTYKAGYYWDSTSLIFGKSAGVFSNRKITYALIPTGRILIGTGGYIQGGIRLKFVATKAEPTEGSSISGLHKSQLPFAPQPSGFAGLDVSFFKENLESDLVVSHGAAARPLNRLQKSTYVTDYSTPIKEPKLPVEFEGL